MKIPKNATWCVDCFKGEPCPMHCAADGATVDYTGQDAYEPTEWVLSVIGKTYNGPDGRVYLCYGYDPRAGFWLKAMDNQEPKVKNISERAIDRTSHSTMR